MPKNLKFNLIHNNRIIRTIDELREYCVIEQLLIDYREGKLQRWLKSSREFGNIIAEIDSLSVENDPEIAQELVRILEIKQQIFASYQTKLEKINNYHIPRKDRQDFSSIFSSVNSFSVLNTFFEQRHLPVTIVTGLTKSSTKSLINQIIESRKDLNIFYFSYDYRPKTLKELNVGYCLVREELAYDNGKGKLYSTCDDLGNIADIVHEILEKSDKIDHLIIDAVEADMFCLTMSFYENELQDITSLDSIIAMLDCADLSLDLFNVDYNKREREYLRLWSDFVEYADIVVFNNVGLVDEVAVDRLEYFIRVSQDQARILRSQKIEVPLPLISSLGWSNIYDIYKTNEYLGTISSFYFENNQAFSLRKFDHFLVHRLSRNVFKVIGILWHDESPKKYLFCISGKRCAIKDDEWNDERKSNSLIFIGINLDSEKLNSQLLDCLSS